MQWLFTVCSMALLLLQNGSSLAVLAQEAGIPAENEQNTNTASDTAQGNSSELPGTEAPSTETDQNISHDSTQSTEAPDTNTTLNPGEIPGGTSQNPVVVPEEPEEEPSHAPKVIVSACNADVEQIEPGMDVTFTVTLRNTSTDAAIYNMKVSYESAAGDLIPLESTNSRYIASIGAGRSAGISFPMHVSKDIMDYSQKITISMEYEDEDAQAFSSSENVFANIYRPLGFYADTPVVPTDVISGTTANISLNLFNTGKATIYDVYCKLECRGFLESGTYYIGNIAPETSVTANLAPIASNRNYGPLGDRNVEKYGDVKGKIIITYKDESGNLYTEEIRMATTISMPPDEMEEPEIEKIEYSSQWWVSIVILLVAVDGLVIVLAYYIRKHRV